MKNDTLVIQKVAEERNQAHSTRKNLYSGLEKQLGLPIIAFFTSFAYPVMIEDNDADMLEGILQKCELSNGFALMLSSPGGDALAAERIVNVCQSYSGTGQYSVIVPSKAKSAASMVCFGAQQIIMAQTSSELGSIDPQRVVQEDDDVKWFSVYNLVKSYEDLFQRAVRTKGNLQPYLQQLANYDQRDIAELKSALSLSEDIAVKILKKGMLSSFSERQIKEKIKIFLTPEKVKVHGRAIYAEEAKNCGLNVSVWNMRGRFWPLVYELYVRLNNYVSRNKVAKCIECQDYSFNAMWSGQ